MTLAVGIGFVCFDLVDKLSKEQTIRYAITWPLSAVNSRLRMLQDPLKIALESFRMTHLRSTVYTRILPIQPPPLINIWLYAKRKACLGSATNSLAKSRYYTRESLFYGPGPEEWLQELDQVHQQNPRLPQLMKQINPNPT